MFNFMLVSCLEYRKELQDVIKDDTSGDFETLLIELCKVGTFSILSVLLPYSFLLTTIALFISTGLYLSNGPHVP